MSIKRTEVALWPAFLGQAGVQSEDKVTAAGFGAPISSNGFIDIFTFAVSTPDLSGLTRIFTA